MRYSASEKAEIIQLVEQIASARQAHIGQAWHPARHVLPLV